MNLGIITIVYGGYGKFIPRWCKAIAKLTEKPKQVTIIACGPDHGLNVNSLKDLVDIAEVKVNYVKELKTMGAARNIAIENTPTDWILYFSADDILLPNAVTELKKYQKSDVIAMRYIELNSLEVKYHETPLMEEEKIQNWLECYKQAGYVAYRRKIWEDTPYIDDEYPNFPFLFQIYRKGAKFVETENECALYLKRNDSHSQTCNKERFDRAVKTINYYAEKLR